MDVLVVEDDPPLREAFAYVFRSFGYEVTTAENGEQALERIRCERPGFMFIDLVMPVMNGFRLIEALRTDSRLADIPLVAMTACNSSAPVGVKVMRKPFGAQTALELVREHLGERPTSRSSPTIPPPVRPTGAR
jgi:CheY-like chemotaxis protein